MAVGRNAALYPKGHPGWDRLDPVAYPREWLDGPRARAKQMDMLRVDVEYAARWVETVQKLVDKELPSDEFTAAYMLELKEWERGRKREQKALHYRYDPLKRTRRLIDRDIDRTLSQARAQIAARKEELRVTVAQLQAHAPASESAAPLRTKRQQPLHPMLDRLDEDNLSMIANLAPDLDVAMASDGELRTVWARRNPAMSTDAIDWCLDLINGTSPDN